MTRKICTFTYPPTIGRALPPLLPPTEAAILQGWRASADLLKAHPYRKHLTRPALQAEISDRHRAPYPEAIVAMHRLRPTIFAQLLVMATPACVEWVRDFLAEADARQLFEAAKRSPALQRRETLSIGADGELRLLGLRTHCGAEPDAGFVCSRWARDPDPRRDRVDPGLLARAGFNCLRDYDAAATSSRVS